MRTRIKSVVLLIVGISAMGVASVPDATATTTRASANVYAPPTAHRAAEIAARLPASYDANEGQFEEGVRFVAEAGGIVAWLVDGETVLKLGDDDPGLPGTLGRPRRRTRSGGVLRMRFPSLATPRGEARLSSTSNWFLGDDSARWRTDVESFGRARYESVAPGVDVVWRGTRRALEYDVVVAPGADLATFSMQIDGARSVAIDAASGDLVVTTPDGAKLRHSHPRCFQVVDGARRDVAGRFVVAGLRVSFAVDEWDRSCELVVDPTLQYATYLGGSSTEVSYSTAVTAAGDLCITGQTLSTNFPLASSVQSSYAGSSDVFITRIRADGSGLVFSTYFGGTGSDYGEAIATDPAGNVYVAAVTNSTNMPTASGVQPSLGGARDGFVVKLVPAGNQIMYATYLGGSQDDLAYGVAADANGSAYVVGYTSSSNFPMAAARQGSYGGGGSDVFVTKLAPSGGAYVYSTFHGGNGTDVAYFCELDASAALVLGGYTTSTDLPLNNAFQSSLAASGTDGFVAKYNAAGNALALGTYLGGGNTDIVNAVTVDSSGAVYACGMTASSNFPTASPTQSLYGGGTYDAFVTKFQSSGGALEFSTYLGGSAEDGALGIVVDSSGGFAVSGYTGSSNFPVVKPLQASYGGGLSDGFVARFTLGATTPAYATFLGGGAEDRLYGVEIDGDGRLCLAGYTVSTNFPVLGAYQPSYGGNAADAVLVRLAPTPPLAPTNLTAALVGTSTAHLTWNDQASDETGFELQRRLNAGSFTTYASLPPGAVSYDDTSLFASQTYTYRVRSIGAEGASTPSNEASVVVPATASAPPVPRAPDGLQAIVVSPTEVELSWRDRSNDETLFEVQRAAGAALAASLGTTPQDVAKFVDGSVPPGWPVTYRVRALAVQGPSAFTTSVTATTLATLTVATTSGLIADSPKTKKDRIRWKGTFALTAGPPATPIDPRTLDVRLQAGPPGAPVSVAISAGDGAWKVKRSKYTWKSAKGVLPKVNFTIDTTKMTYSVKASGFDYGTPADTAARLLLALGGDAGGITQTWVAQRTAGNFAPPKP